jgi:hypothetical protein
MYISATRNSVVVMHVHIYSTIPVVPRLHPRPLLPITGGRMGVQKKIEGLHGLIKCRIYGVDGDQITTCKKNVRTEEPGQQAAASKKQSPAADEGGESATLMSAFMGEHFEWS